MWKQNDESEKKTKKWSDWELSNECTSKLHSHVLSNTKQNTNTNANDKPRKIQFTTQTMTMRVTVNVILNTFCSSISHLCAINTRQA